jgi:tripartite motif-containing protein 37
VSQFYRQPVSTEFDSELVPPYDAGCFDIFHFEELAMSEDVVYSEPLVSGGLTWRLKVYPNGETNFS